MKKTSLILFSIILLVFVLANFNFASGRVLEVEYPKIGEYEITETTTSIPQYVRYIYYFAISISGLIALAVLVWAGLKYFTSAGNPERLKTSKEQIVAAFLGLIILFGSWLIVNTINPQLTLLQVGPLQVFAPELPPGVFFCKKQIDFYSAWVLTEEYTATKTSEERKQIKEDLQPILEEIAKNCYGKLDTYPPEKIRDEVAEGIEYIYTVPKKATGTTEEEGYGVLLFEEEHHLGNIQVVFPYELAWFPVPVERKKTINRISSVAIFRLVVPDEDTVAILYEHQDYNRFSPGGKQEYPPEGNWEAYNNYYIGNDIFDDIKGDLGGNSPQSIRLRGDVIVILHKQGEPGLFLFSSETNLLSWPSVTKEDCTGPIWWRKCVRVPAADGLSIIAGKRLW